MERFNILFKQGGYKDCPVERFEKACRYIGKTLAEISLLPLLDFSDTCSFTTLRHVTPFFLFHSIMVWNECGHVVLQSIVRSRPFFPLSLKLSFAGLPVTDSMSFTVWKHIPDFGIDLIKKYVVLQTQLEESDYFQSYRFQKIPGFLTTF